MTHARTRMQWHCQKCELGAQPFPLPFPSVCFSSLPFTLSLLYPFLPFLLSLLKSSARRPEERCELPQRGLGRSSSRNGIWCIISFTYRSVGNKFNYYFPENQMTTFRAVQTCACLVWRTERVAGPTLVYATEHTESRTDRQQWTTAPENYRWDSALQQSSVETRAVPWRAQPTQCNSFGIDYTARLSAITDPTDSRHWQWLINRGRQSRGQLFTLNFELSVNCHKKFSSCPTIFVQKCEIWS